MVMGVRAAPFTYVAHTLAVVAAVMVLVWCIHFRGGLAFEDTNKNLIFNVSSTRALLCDFPFVFWKQNLMPRRVAVCSFTKTLQKFWTID
jgi:hypothetical protein